MQNTHCFKMLCFALLASAVGLFQGCSSVNVPKISGEGNKDGTPMKGGDPLKVKKAAKAKPLKREVRTDGGLLLGQADNLAFSPNQMASGLNQFAGDQQWTVVRRWVDLYPDIVTRSMLEGHLNIDDSMAKKIAILIDRKWSAKGTQPWYEFLSEPKYASFPKLRQKFQNHLQLGQISEALELGLSKSFQGQTDSVALAESLRLEGVAYLLEENYPAAEEKFNQSIQQFGKVFPPTAPSVQLMLGEVHRKTGNKVGWKEQWSSAVSRHSFLLKNKGLQDPGFWKNAAFVKPYKTDWPSDSKMALKDSLTKCGLLKQGQQLSSRTDVLVWSFVGQSSLVRNESQNAILAFKKAEASADRIYSDEFQLRQAKAMIIGQQSGAATAILVRLGSKPNSVSDRSKAVLATLKLQEGSLAQGMNLLQNSIASSETWPEEERLRALADYGLAYLMRGKEAQGVALLMNVHQEFLNRKDMVQAVQVLDNLATYYEKTEQMQRQSDVLATVKKINQF